MATTTGLEYFNPAATWAAEWTATQLTQANIDWLLELPYTISAPTFALVHASPAAPDKFEYVLDVEDASSAFGASADVVTFIGHSH